MLFSLMSIILIQAVVMNTSTEITPISSLINSFMRLEGSLANMSCELQSTKSELASVKTNLEKTNREVIAVKTNLETTDKELTTVKSNLQSTKKELVSTKENLAAKTFRLDTLEKKALNLENVTDRISHRGDVVYQVRQMKDGLSLSNNEVLKFDDVTLNTGNAYNPRSGIFITPVTGTYLFWCNVMHKDKNGHDITVKLMKKGIDLANGYTTYENRYGVATITYVTMLEKGDNVWFASSSISNLAIFHGAFAHYGGALLTLSLN